jgi:hypothetical protein
MTGPDRVISGRGNRTRMGRRVRTARRIRLRTDHRRRRNIIAKASCEIRGPVFASGVFSILMQLTRTVHPLDSIVCDDAPAMRLQKREHDAFIRRHHAVKRTAAIY